MGSYPVQFPTPAPQNGVGARLYITVLPTERLLFSRGDEQEMSNCKNRGCGTDQTFQMQTLSRARIVGPGPGTLFIAISKTRFNNTAFGEQRREG
jgi:hypothetical protein